MKTTKTAITTFILIACSTFLVSCGGKRKESTSTLVLKSLALAAGEGGGGAVVYARHENGQTLVIPFEKGADAEGVELDLNNGRWNFSAAVWKGGGGSNDRPLEGDLTCASASADLQGLGDVEVDLTLDEANCVTGQIQTQLRLAVCRLNGIAPNNLYDNDNLNTSCLNTEAIVGSYRVTVETNSIHGKNLSSCIDHTDSNSVIHDSNVELPVNLAWSDKIKIEAFEESGCNESEPKISYYLNSGEGLYGGDFVSRGDNLNAVILLVCPAGYLYVAGDSALGTKPFCVMQHEARDDGDPVASDSSRGDSPWEPNDFEEAFEGCANLPPPLNPDLWGGDFSLITNAQWVAITDNIASVGENFDDNSTPNDDTDDFLYPGHSDNNPSSVLNITNPNDNEDGTAGNNTSGQKRTFKLATGGVLWDFAGNLAEWVAWNKETGPFPEPNDDNTIPDSSSWGLLNDVSFFGASVLAPASYSSTAGWGKWYQESGGLYAVRGGDFDDTNDESNTDEHGLGQLILTNEDASSINTNVGFRCVYNLPF